MAKRPVPRYDFKAFGEAVKAARKGRKESRKKVCKCIYLRVTLRILRIRGSTPAYRYSLSLYNCLPADDLIPQAKGSQRGAEGTGRADDD